MIKAYRLFTGPDGDPHVQVGTLREHERKDVLAIHFAETAAHSNFDRHKAPDAQYVITPSAALGSTMLDGHTFILRRGGQRGLLARFETGSRDDP